MREAGVKEKGAKKIGRSLDKYPIKIVPREALKKQSLSGNSSVRKRRRLKALAVAAARRVQKLRTILDRDDPIADERYNRDNYWRGVQQQAERAKTAAAQVKNLLRRQQTNGECLQR